MSGDTIGEPSEALPTNPLGPASTSDTSAPLPTQDQQPLSKNAQKRLAKAAYLEEKKRERRAAEKERKKEKKRALAEKRAAGELDEDEVGGRSNKRQKTEQGPRAPFGARIVVDLGFDDMMTENVSVRNARGGMRTGSLTQLAGVWCRRSSRSLRSSHTRTAPTAKHRTRLRRFFSRL